MILVTPNLWVKRLASSNKACNHFKATHKHLNEHKEVRYETKIGERYTKNVNLDPGRSRPALPKRA